MDALEQEDRELELDFIKYRKEQAELAEWRQETDKMLEEFKSDPHRRLRRRCLANKVLQRYNRGTNRDTTGE